MYAVRFSSFPNAGNSWCFVSYSHSNCLNVVKNISYFSKLYIVTFTLDQQYSIEFCIFFQK